MHKIIVLAFISRVARGVSELGVTVCAHIARILHCIQSGATKRNLSPTNMKLRSY